MARQFILQPNGKWAIYSTAMDCLEGIDFTEEELIEGEVRQAADRAREETRKYLEARKSGKGFTQFSVSWEKAVRDTRKRISRKEDAEFLDALDEASRPAEVNP